MIKKSHRLKIYAAIAIVALGGLYYYNNIAGRTADTLDASLRGKKAIVYKSPTCGCCAQYASYLKRQGFIVEVVNNNSEMVKIKNKYKIPAEDQSCHTTVIGDYFIEGHIPVAAINKLLAERPAVAGIALPGMPSGSPGMPGKKTSPFLIDSVDTEGNINSYMEL